MINLIILISPIVLKITDLITWSWIWVLCPVLLITTIVIIGLIIVLIEMRKKKELTPI